MKKSIFAVAIFVCGSVEAVATNDVAEFYKEQCLNTSDFASCEMWQEYDPKGFEQFTPYEYQFLEVEDLAGLWGVSVATIQKAVADNPQLLQVKAVESEFHFNPFSVNLEQLEQEPKRNADRIYKWLRYRRNELGVCFEDERFDENLDRCVVIE